MRPNNMRVKVRLFGPLKEFAGAADEWRELREDSSVGEFMAGLRGEASMPERLLGVSAVAVNQEYAAESRVLKDGDEVAILPPVSGGRS